jgi:hypothetical protein
MLRQNLQYDLKQGEIIGEATQDNVFNVLSTSLEAKVFQSMPGTNTQLSNRKTFTRVATLGKECTGKSCILTQLVQNKFNEQYPRV